MRKIWIPLIVIALISSAVYAKFSASSETPEKTTIRAANGINFIDEDWNLALKNFSKAITISNNQELIWATRKEQLIAEGCKRLIANAVNAYNLLLLSEKLSLTHSEEKQILLKIIWTSTQSWAHINLVGEYDFSDGQD